MGLDKIEKQGSGKRKNINVLTPGTERANIHIERGWGRETGNAM